MDFDAAIAYLKKEQIDSFLIFNEAIISVIKWQYQKINSQEKIDDINQISVDALTLCFSKVIQEHLNEEQKQNLYEYFEFINTLQPFFEKTDEFRYLFNLPSCVSEFRKESYKPNFSFAIKDILTQNWSTFTEVKIREMQQASRDALISQDFCYSLSELFKIAPRIRASLFIYETLNESTGYLSIIKNDLFDSSSRNGCLLDGLVKVQDKDFVLLLEKIIQAKENHQSRKFQALEDLLYDENIDINQIRNLVNQPDEDFKKTKCCSIM